MRLCSHNTHPRSVGAPVRPDVVRCGMRRDASLAPGFVVLRSGYAAPVFHVSKPDHRSLMIAWIARDVDGGDRVLMHVGPMRGPQIRAVLGGLSGFGLEVVEPHSDDFKEVPISPRRVLRLMARVVTAPIWLLVDLVTVVLKGKTKTVFVDGCSRLGGKGWMRPPDAGDRSPLLGPPDSGTDAIALPLPDGKSTSRVASD